MVKPTTTFLICLILLLPLVLAQRGGGGGGHSGGGGGHSSGGSFGRRTRSCQEKCFGNPDPECVTNCQSQGATVGIIWGSVFGGLVCAGVSAACCSCSWFKRWPCHKYQKLKKQMNVVSAGTLTEQEYKMKRDHIISLFNRSKNEGNFGYIQTSEKQRIEAEAQIVNEDKFLTELKLTGNDRYGDWSANGFIVAKNGGMCFWMYKEYEDKDAAGQTGKWEHLIYESTSYNEETGMEGKWYYVDYEDSSLYSGFWKLSTSALPHL